MPINRRDFIQLSLLSLSLSSPKIIASKSISSLNDILKIIKERHAGKHLSVYYPKGSFANIGIVNDFIMKKTGIKIETFEGSLDDISSEIMVNESLGDSKKKMDIAIPASFNIPALAKNKVILQLDQLEKKFNGSRVKGRSLYNLADRYLENLYGYQTDGDVYILFINKRLFKSSKYQNAYYKKFKRKLLIPETWEELDTQIKFFHEIDEGISGGNLYRNLEYLHWEFWVRLHGKGVYPLDDNFSSRLNSKEALSALNEMLNISKYLNPRSYEDNMFSCFEEFSKGQSYCCLGWGGTQKYIKNDSSSILKDDVIFAQLPGGRRNGKVYNCSYFNWGWNYVIPSSAKEPELSYLYLLAASTDEMTTLSVRESKGYFDPHKEVHYQDKVIESIYGKSFLETHYTSLKEAIPDLYVSGQEKYFSSLKQTLNRVINNQMNAKDALILVHEHWEKITETLGRDKQIAQWKILKDLYPNHLKSILK